MNILWKRLLVLVLLTIKFTFLLYPLFCFQNLISYNIVDSIRCYYISFSRKLIYRYFRVVRADVFIANFASDRKHMVKENTDWMMPPPPYACIQTIGESPLVTIYIILTRVNTNYAYLQGTLVTTYYTYSCYYILYLLLLLLTVVTTYYIYSCY